MNPSSNQSLRELQAQIKAFLQARSWYPLRPSDIAKSVSIESAELLEHFQWADHTPNQIKKDPAKLADIKKEIADVIIYAIEMGIMLDFDVNDAIQEKIAHNGKKYPAELFAKLKGKKKGTEEIYKKIKREYRAKANS